MPKHSARDLARINNFGHHKKLRTSDSDKENVNVQMALQASHSKPQNQGHFLLQLTSIQDNLSVNHTTKILKNL